MVLRLPRPSRGGDLTLEVSPLLSNDAPALGIQQVRALLVVHSPRTVADEAAARFREAYGLTLAESKLVRTLLEGVRCQTWLNGWEYAIRPRAQLRTVFAKTQTHHQSDLIRLVYGFAH
jgi:hypothetical protein